MNALSPARKPPPPSERGGALQRRGKYCAPPAPLAPTPLPWVRLPAAPARGARPGSPLLSCSAFTLLELLVVIAIVALLSAILVPVSLRAVEDARVARAMTELRSVEAALEAYRADHKQYPPCSISCQSSDADEELQLPRELADGGYLPPSPTRASTLLPDPFHPGSTYKYIASLPYWLNGQHMPAPYPVWVPSDFPLCRETSGKYMTGHDCPLDWAIWSIGPRHDALPSTTRDRLPLDSRGWRTRPGHPGIIARIKPRDGSSFSVP